MGNSKKQFLVETDILIDHLTTKKNGKSTLEKLMECGICFTTVINSAEIYFAVQNDEEKSAVDSLMRAVKVIGFNSRYSLYVDQYTGRVEKVRDALICVAAKINKLPIVTDNTERYSSSELEIVHSDKI